MTAMNNIRAKFSISTLSPHFGGVVAAHDLGVALDELTLEEVRPASSILERCCSDLSNRMLNVFWHSLKSSPTNFSLTKVV
jgi:hypothetical protein